MSLWNSFKDSTVQLPLCDKKQSCLCINQVHITAAGSVDIHTEESQMRQTEDHCSMLVFFTTCVIM